MLKIQHKVKFNSSAGYGPILLNPLKFIEFDGDQARELVNTRQRYLVWRQARERLAQTKGSMVWHRSARGAYLVKSYYEKSGVRKQRSLGRRSPETEALKREFETGRAQAQERFAAISETLKRQAAVNRALGLGRVPRITADILRALDDTGALGHGLRVVGDQRRLRLRGGCRPCRRCGPDDDGGHRPVRQPGRAALHRQRGGGGTLADQRAAQGGSQLRAHPADISRCQCRRLSRRPDQADAQPALEAGPLGPVADGRRPRRLGNRRAGLAGKRAGLRGRGDR
jgi:hypothetical protein